MLPMLEVVVGLCLLLGLVTRPASVVSVLLQVAFIVGLLLLSLWLVARPSTPYAVDELLFPTSETEEHEVRVDA